MFFGKKTAAKMNINIYNERIEKVDSICYLGITIDIKLTFKNLIEVVKQN